jgi:hypothetical protein
LTLIIYWYFDSSFFPYVSSFYKNYIL